MKKKYLMPEFEIVSFRFSSIMANGGTDQDQGLDVDDFIKVSNPDIFSSSGTEWD